MDLEKLSDAEIDQLYNKTVQTRKPANNLENLSDEEIDKLFQETQKPQEYGFNQGLQDIVTGTREVLSGATAGLSEPYFAGVNAITQKIAGSEKPFSELYQQDIEAQRQNATLPVKIAGGLVGALIPGSAASRITQGAAELIPQGASVLGRIASGAGQAAIGAAGEQALIEAPKIASGEKTPEQAFQDLKTAATYGGAIGAGTRGLVETAKAAPELAKKTLGLVGGVKEETINKYIQKHDAIKNAPSKEQVINEIDDFVGNLKTDLADKKITLDDAKNALKSSIQENRFILGEQGQDLRQKITQANQQLNDAYNSAINQLKDKANLQRLTSDVEDSIGKLKERVSRGSGESYNLLDQASAEGVTLNRQGFIDAIDEQIKKLKVGGGTVGESRKQAVNKLESLKNDLKSIQSPYATKINEYVDQEIKNMSEAIASSQAGQKIFKDGQFIGTQGSTFPDWFNKNGFSSKEEFLSAVKRGKGKVYDKIKKMAEDRLEKGYDDGNFGRSEPLEGFKQSKYLMDELDPVQVKEIMRSIDEDINYAVSNNQFMEALDLAQAKVRGAMNNELKKIPGYSEKMQEVADDTRLLAELNRKFKDPTAIRSRLSGVTKDVRTEDAKLLEKLGEKTGMNYKAEIQAAKDVESVLADDQKLRGIKALLPPKKDLDKYESQLAKITDPRSRTKFIVEQTKGENKKVADAMKAFQESRDTLAKVSSLKTESRSAVNTFLASTKEKNLELFKRLSDLSGKDFVTTLENIGVREAFNKEATQGSRRVNLFALLSGGITSGAAIGGAPGAAVGAVFGYMVDKYGPKMTQEILDGVVKVGKNPNVDSINKLIKNDKVRKFLINELNTATRQKALER